MHSAEARAAFAATALAALLSAAPARTQAAPEPQDRPIARALSWIDEGLRGSDASALIASIWRDLQVGGRLSRFVQALEQRALAPAAEGVRRRALALLHQCASHGRWEDFPGPERLKIARCFEKQILDPSLPVPLRGEVLVWMAGLAGTPERLSWVLEGSARLERHAAIRRSSKDDPERDLLPYVAGYLAELGEDASAAIGALASQLEGPVGPRTDERELRRAVLRALERIGPHAEPAEAEALFVRCAELARDEAEPAEEALMVLIALAGRLPLERERLARAHASLLPSGGGAFASSRIRAYGRIALRGTPRVASRAFAALWSLRLREPSVEDAALGAMGEIACSNSPIFGEREARQPLFDLLSAFEALDEKNARLSPLSIAALRMLTLLATRIDEIEDGDLREELEQRAMQLAARLIEKPYRGMRDAARLWVRRSKGSD
ncbi:MAG: hypothetical protein Fur0037_26950 [Planctomycetota bacterium]